MTKTSLSRDHLPDCHRHHCCSSQLVVYETKGKERHTSRRRAKMGSSKQAAQVKSRWHATLLGVPVTQSKTIKVTWANKATTLLSLDLELAEEVGLLAKEKKSEEGKLREEGAKLFRLIPSVSTTTQLSISKRKSSRQKSLTTWTRYQ